MKGIIFTSFIDFVEEQFDATVVEDMLDGSELSTGGAYTIVGTYPSRELLDMAGFIIKRYDLEPSSFLQSLGEFTFGKLVGRYDTLVSEFRDSFDCIYHVDQTIHKNVRKLYPDAELPDMKARLSDDGNRLTLEYRSTRPFMFLAHGLITGCLKYYGDTAELTMTDRSDGAGTHAEFVLIRNG